MNCLNMANKIKKYRQYGKTLNIEPYEYYH